MPAVSVPHPRRVVAAVVAVWLAVASTVVAAPWAAAAPAAFATDSFARPDGPLGETEVGGLAWANVGDVDATIATQRARSASVGTALAVIDAGSADGAVAGVATAYSGSSTTHVFSGVAARVADTSNYLALRINKLGSPALVEVTGGTATTLWSSAVRYSSPRLELRVSGQAAGVVIDGQYLGTVRVSSPSPSATGFGFASTQTGTNANGTLDDVAFFDDANTVPPPPAGARTLWGDGTATVLIDDTFDPADLAAYDVVRDGAVVATLPPGTTEWTDTGLANGTAYRYELVAVDTAGNRSFPSGHSTATPGVYDHVAFDDFERSNRASVDGPTPVGARTYTEVGDLVPAVAGGTLRSASPGLALTVIDAGTVDGSVDATVDAQSGSSTTHPFAGVAARVVDAGTYLALRVDKFGRVSLTQFSSGAATTLWSTTVSHSKPHLELRVSGTVAEAVINGQHAATVHVPAPDPSGTRFGFVATQNSTNASGYATGLGVHDDPATAPAPPAPVRTLWGDGTATVLIDDTFDPADLAAYDVVRDGAVVATVPPGTTEWTDTGLANGVGYRYELVAVDAAGNRSFPSGHSTATPGVYDHFAFDDFERSYRTDADGPTPVGARTYVQLGDAPGPDLAGGQLRFLGIGVAVTGVDVGHADHAVAANLTFSSTNTYDRGDFGLVARYVDDANRLVLLTDRTDAGKFTLVEYVGGAATSLWAANYDKSTAHRVEVRVEGSQATVTVDGTEAATVSVAGTAGTVAGVRANWTQRSSASRMLADDLEVNLAGAARPPSWPDGASLRVTGHTETSLDLAWDAASSAATYDIHVDGTYDHTVDAPTTTSTLAGLAPGSTHDLTVVAVNDGGTASAPMAATGTTAPRWPDAASLSANDVTDTTATLTWPAADGAAGYRLFRGPDEVATLPADTTSHDLADLRSDSSHTYSVEAFARDAAGPVTLTVLEATFTTTQTPVTWPADAAVTVTGRTHDTLRIAWTPADGAVAAYDVIVDGAIVATVAAAETSATLTGLLPDTEHDIVIIASDTNGKGVSGPTTTGTTLPPPPSWPDGSALRADLVYADAAAVAWTAATGTVVGYRLVDASGNVVADVPAGTLAATVASLAADSTHTFTVVAYDDHGRTATGPSVAVETPPVGYYVLHLSWPQPDGVVEQYRVMVDDAVDHALPGTRLSTSVWLRQGVASKVEIVIDWADPDEPDDVLPVASDERDDATRSIELVVVDVGRTDATLGAYGISDASSVTLTLSDGQTFSGAPDDVARTVVSDLAPGAWYWARMDATYPSGESATTTLYSTMSSDGEAGVGPTVAFRTTTQSDTSPGDGGGTGDGGTGDGGTGDGGTGDGGTGDGGTGDGGTGDGGTGDGGTGDGGTGDGGTGDGGTGDGGTGDGGGAGSPDSWLADGTDASFDTVRVEYDPDTGLIDLHLSWPPAAGDPVAYQVVVDGEVEQELPGTQTSTVVRGLDPAVPHTVLIVAVYGDGTSLEGPATKLDAQAEDEGTDGPGGDSDGSGGDPSHGTDGGTADGADDDPSHGTDGGTADGADDDPNHGTDGSGISTDPVDDSPLPATGAPAADLLAIAMFAAAAGCLTLAWSRRRRQRR